MIKKIRKILEKEKCIEFAYLYGSFAKGKQRKESDIDIAIQLKDIKVLEKDPLYPIEVAKKIERTLKTKKDVDVRILNNSSIIFAHQVVNYGKLVFSRDQKLNVRFEADVFKKYFDFQPFIRQYDKIREKRILA